MIRSSTAIVVVLRCSVSGIFRANAQIATTSQSTPKLEHIDISQVDKTLNPCQDFYQYACSKWNPANPIPEGRKFDAQGNLRDWWTPEDAKAYEQRGECIANEYTEEIPEAGVKQNGHLTPRIHANPCAHQPAFRTEIPGEQCGLQYARVSGSFYLQERLAHGASQSMQGLMRFLSDATRPK
jgi:hypothetical protein